MNTPTFPTGGHRKGAETVRDFFGAQSSVDTVLVVNSCARGKGVPDSDLDFAILVKPNRSEGERRRMENEWQRFAQIDPTLEEYGRSTPFAKIHLDIIEGKYKPEPMEDGGGIDYFEVEIGNQVQYAAPMGNPGEYFLELRHKWLPFYPEALRAERLAMICRGCEYDLEHIPRYAARGLHFYAFDRLYIAFQKYLQALFIARRTYPIAYNKWIREQVEDILTLPALYPRLAPIISVREIASDEINNKAEQLKLMLNELN